MIALDLPWLEIAILLALLGAVGVNRVRDPQRAARMGTALTGTAFLCTLLAWAAFALGVTHASTEASSAPDALPTAGRRTVPPSWIASRPARGRGGTPPLPDRLGSAADQDPACSFSWSLFSEAIRLATFSCQEPWLLIGLLAANTVPPLVELLNRGASPRPCTSCTRVCSSACSSWDGRSSIPAATTPCCRIGPRPVCWRRY